MTAAARVAIVRYGRMHIELAHSINLKRGGHLCGRHTWIQLTACNRGGAKQQICLTVWDWPKVEFQTSMHHDCMSHAARIPKRSFQRTDAEVWLENVGKIARQDSLGFNTILSFLRD